MTAETLPANGPLELEIDAPQDSRNRLTVAFRGLLMIPHYVVVLLLVPCVIVVGFLGWVGALVTGWLPTWARNFHIGVQRYSARVSAYFYMLTDQYPPFKAHAPDYDVQIDVPPPGKLNRWAVLFRFIITIPANIVIMAVAYGWAMCAFFMWLVVVVTGRTPAPIFTASAAVMRYSLRLGMYYQMVTATYPRRLFGDAEAEDTEARSQTRPLVLPPGGRRLLGAFIVLGALYWIFSQFVQPILLTQMVHH